MEPLSKGTRIRSMRTSHADVFRLEYRDFFGPWFLRPIHRDGPPFEVPSKKIHGTFVSKRIDPPTVLFCMGCGEVEVDASVLRCLFESLQDCPIRIEGFRDPHAQGREFLCKLSTLFGIQENMLVESFPVLVVEQ